MSNILSLRIMLQSVFDFLFFVWFGFFCLFVNCRVFSVNTLYQIEKIPFYS